VDVMDMPPCPPYALSVSGKEQFSPHGVTYAAPGSFVFSDSLRQQVSLSL